MRFSNRERKHRIVGRCRRARPALGTFVEIELRGEAGERVLDSWITEGFRAISEIDKLMSCHREDSDITRLNRAEPGVWIKAHPHTIKVLERSNEMFAASRGAFDIRCGAFLAKNGLIPQQHTSLQDCSPFASAAQRFSYIAAQHWRPPPPREGSLVPSLPPFDNRGKQGLQRPSVKYVAAAPVETCETRVRKTGPWILDLGGIAKGYAVDRAIETIQRLANGIRTSGIVNAGGDLRTWGDAAPVTIRIPGRRRDRAWTLRLENSAVAVSSVRSHANSKLRFTRAAHVRMPALKLLEEPKTVAVFAKTCIEADALTKVALLESNEATACLPQFQARALLFHADGRLAWSIA